MLRGKYVRNKEINKKSSESAKLSYSLGRIHAKGMLNKKHSQTTKLKMKETHKKNISNSCFKKGQTAWNKNKKMKPLSIEFRNKLSIIHKDRKENCPFWKGGITQKNQKIRSSFEYRLWREAVFARDNFTCQKCFQKGNELHPHHIMNFSTFLSLRFAIDNGITLCKKCHIEFHKRYNKNNNTKEQLEEFICH